MSKSLRFIVGLFAVAALSVSAFAGTSMAAPTHHAASGTVYFIGPETYTGRWVRDDAYIKAQLHTQCPACTYEFQNGNDSYQTQLQDAQTDLAASGNKVIILAAVDSTLDAGIVDLAAAQSPPVAVIAYDRMIQDPKLNAYVSFNGPQVGQVQGQYLAYALAQKKVKSGNIIQIWGSDDDNNAHLFLSGFQGAFDKYFKCPKSSPDTCSKKGTFKDAYHTFTQGWVPGTAATEIQTALGLVKNKVVGVYSMNDGMADTIEPALANVHKAGIPLTGQDGQPSALARILKGTQGMTVYKPLTEEAYPATKAAVWYLEGNYAGSPPGFKANVQCKQTVGSDIEIPCDIGPVQSITDFPIKSLKSLDVSFPVKDGFTTWAAVCADVVPTPPSMTKAYCGLKHKA